MPLDTSIYMPMIQARTPLRDWFEQAQGVEQLKNMQMHNSAMQDEMSMKRKAIEDENEIRRIAQEVGGDPENLIPALRQRGFSSQAAAIESGLLKNREEKAKIEKGEWENQWKRNEAMKGAVFSLYNDPELNHDKIYTSLAEGAKNGLWSPQQAQLFAVQIQNTTQQGLKQLIANAGLSVMNESQRLDALKPKVMDTGSEQVLYDTLTGEKKKSYKKEMSEEERQKFEELKRKNRVEESMGWAKINLEKQAQEGGVQNIKPEALDMITRQFVKTGQMPPLGMGKQATQIRQQIINNAPLLAAKEELDTDLASNKAQYGANQGSLSSMQKMRDAVTSFEKTASANLDNFIKQASKVVDSGSPLANKPIRYVDQRLLGSSDQLAFNAARQVAVNEIAKVTSNPTLAGQLSDSARHEVSSFIPEDATMSQILKVAKILKSDMENRKKYLDESISDISGRIKGRSPKSVVTEINPKNGKTYYKHPDGNYYLEPPR